MRISNKWRENAVFKSQNIIASAAEEAQRTQIQRYQFKSAGTIPAGNKHCGISHDESFMSSFELSRKLDNIQTSKKTHILALLELAGGKTATLVGT